jgi:hypothetical protein
MTNIFSKQLLIATVALIPSFAAAQAPSTFREFAELIVAIVKYGVILLFVSLGVGLAYGVVVYLAHADDAKMRESIRSYLLWGVIGIAVVFGLWGLLAILSSTFGWGSVGIPLISPPEA